MKHSFREVWSFTNKPVTYPFSNLCLQMKNIFVMHTTKQRICASEVMRCSECCSQQWHVLQTQTLHFNDLALPAASVSYTLCIFSFMKPTYQFKYSSIPPCA